jgi:hypothetical protein
METFAQPKAVLPAYFSGCIWHCSANLRATNRGVCAPLGQFNFSIGTKLGVIAGPGVALVGGMLGKLMLGNQSIAESNRLVIINHLNKGNARAT